MQHLKSNYVENYKPVPIVQEAASDSVAPEALSKLAAEQHQEYSGPICQESYIHPD
jgi:hypothetical protein